MSDSLRRFLESIPGARPIDKAALDAYRKEMTEKLIPELEAEQRRKAHARDRIIRQTALPQGTNLLFKLSDELQLKYEDWISLELRREVFDDGVTSWLLIITKPSKYIVFVETRNLYEFHISAAPHMYYLTPGVETIHDYELLKKRTLQLLETENVS